MIGARYEIGKRDTAGRRHICSQAVGKPKGVMPGVQPCEAQENGPLFERFVFTGRCGLELLALRPFRGADLWQ